MSVFCGDMRSCLTFRCINKYLSVLTNIQNNIVYKDLKKGNNKGYTIWNIRDTNNFIASSLNNSSIPTNMVYVLNKSFFSALKSLSTIAAIYSPEYFCKTVFPAVIDISLIIVVPISFIHLKSYGAHSFPVSGTG